MNKRDLFVVVDLLRPIQSRYHHALLIFDKHGSGAESESREHVEAAIEESLFRNGWEKGAVAVIVIKPELESWVWADSPRVANVLGWGNESSELRSFLKRRGLWDDDRPKPHDPKEAMTVACREKRMQRNASLFDELAFKVSFKKCQDPAFRKFHQKLSEWFGVDSV